MSRIDMKPSDYIRKGWCQGWYARDAKGFYRTSLSPEAASWCLAGAIFASGINEREAYRLLAAKLGEPRSDALDALVSWNDAPERTQQEVIDLLESVGL